MKERPILFSGPMVQAIIGGRKTQTRRISKHQFWSYSELHDANKEGGYAGQPCPYGKHGDRLWVRETHYRFGNWQPMPGVKTRGGRTKWKFVPLTITVFYDPPPNCDVRLGRHHKDPETAAWHKRLGRFMPHADARIFLEVDSVRVERLNQISEGDAEAEGIEPDPTCPDSHWMQYGPHFGGTRTAEWSFQTLWESINGDGSWDKNPWVWVVEFKRVQP